MKLKHEVFWKNPHYQPFPQLNASTNCEYLIVGGGIAGVSLAYFLAKEGVKNIIIAERNTIASGATGNAAGSLVASAVIDLKDLVRKHGAKKSQAHWKMLEGGLGDIKKIILAEKIPCDFEVMDTLYLSLNKNQDAILHEEYTHLKKINSKTRIIHGKNLREKLNSAHFSKSIYSPKNGVSVNPLQLTQNWAKVVAKKGVRIYERTPVLQIEGNTARTPHGTITFDKIIWAIDAAHPSEHVQNLKTTIVITRPLTQTELKETGLIQKKILWDANENYGYGKVTKDNRLLIGSGGTIVHKRYNRKDPHHPHLNMAQKWLKRLFPYLSLRIDYAWSATYGVTPDHRPIIEQKKNTYSIAGAGSQVLSVMASRELAKKILRKPHRLDLVYL